MTLDDVKQIEEELNVTLPMELTKHYVSNLLEGIDDFPLVAELFFMTPETIIKINKGLRANGLWGKGFPLHFFVIGRGEGEYYITNLREKHLRVYRFMNNKEWAYNTDDLENNLTCSVPGKQGLDTYIKSYPLSFLRSNQVEKRRAEKGLSETELSSDDVYDWLSGLSKRSE